MASQTHSPLAMPDATQQRRAASRLGCLALLLEDRTPPQRIHLGLLEECLLMGLGIC